MFNRIVNIIRNRIKISDAVRNLGVDEFLHELHNSKNAILVDVRTRKELAEGQMNGAIHLDFFDSNFQAQINRLDKDKHYFVYCRSGRRSLHACRAMQNIGIENTMNLKGGFVSYQSEKGQ